MEYFRQRFIDELNDEGPVKIRDFEWPTVDVFKSMAPELFDAHFVDWLGPVKETAKERAREFLTKYGCIDRFKRLAAQSGRETVVPFVGAGLSAPSGYPLWGDFLRSLTADFPACRPDLDDHIVAGRYEEAAQLLLESMGQRIFDEAIQNTFGHRGRPIEGPIKLLPQRFRRGAISTNFDYVLEEVYRVENCPFGASFAGTSLRDAPRRIGDHPHCLLRIHGEADSAFGRVLTREEYDAVYGEEGSYRELLGTCLGTTSLLFIGCSLASDRTLAALADLKQAAQVETPRHFALLPFPGEENRQGRRIQLGEADIHPIWYPPEDHNQAIEDLLIALIEGGIDE